MCQQATERATTITIRTEWVKMGKVSFDLISQPNGKGSSGSLSLPLLLCLPGDKTAVS